MHNLSEAKFGGLICAVNAPHRIRAATFGRVFRYAIIVCFAISNGSDLTWRIAKAEADEALVEAGLLDGATNSRGEIDPSTTEQLPTSKSGTEDVDAVQKAAAVGEKHLQAIKTAHLKFRHAATGRFRMGMTPIRCAHLLDQHDLVKRPDELRNVIQGLSEDLRFDPPWSESEIYLDGLRCRTETDWKSNQHQFIHITDDKLSIRWDGQNSQVDIESVQDNRLRQMNRSDFWQSIGLFTGLDLAKSQIERGGGKITLSSTEQGHSSLIIVDETTGFQTKQVLRNPDGGVVRVQQWLGWETGIAGVPFPRVCVRLDFNGKDGHLSFADFMIIGEARFNIELPETVFRLGSPGGSAIFDRRRDAGQGFHGRINRDLFDVTSVPQRQVAAAPLDQELNAEEKRGVEDLLSIYSLPEGRVVKRIGPPYPISRKYVGRMLGDRYLMGRREIRSDLIQSVDGKFNRHTCFTGGSYKLSQLLNHLTKTELTSIEGDASVLNREIPGDFVFRPDASSDQLIAGLCEIARDEFQKPIRMEFRDVDRNVFVAEGQLNLKLPAGTQYVAVNGGKHTGDYGESIGSGNLSRLLATVSNYIHLKVIDKTTPSPMKLDWSERWYDLPTTKAENRFTINPVSVLQQVAEQTGITFTEETQTFRILFVEVDMR